MSKLTLFFPAALVAALVVPSTAKAQFSRDQFLSSVAVPLTELAATVRSERVPKVYLDHDMLQSSPWVELVDIPELALLTDGKRAGYLLGLAYLASK